MLNVLSLFYYEQNKLSFDLSQWFYHAVLTKLSLFYIFCSYDTVLCSNTTDKIKQMEMRF